MLPKRLLCVIFARKMLMKLTTGLLTSAGGNLGLMLGFSCLSVLFAVINWIKSKLSSKFA